MKLSTWQGPERHATPEAIAEIVAELPVGGQRFIVLTPDGDSDASSSFMQAAWMDGGFAVEIREGAQLLRCARRDLTVEEVREAFCQYLRAEGAFHPPWPFELASFSVRPRIVARWHASWSIYRALATFVPLAALLTAMSMFGGCGLAPTEVPLFATLTLTLVLSVVLLRWTLFRDTVLVVGTDGFALRWPSHERFVRYGEVEGISRYERRSFTRTGLIRGVAVTLASGEKLLVPMGSVVSDGQVTRLDQVTEVEECLRDALRRYDQHRSADELSRLRRGRQTTTSWVTALRAAGAGASATHRKAPVLAEELLPIVADLKASPVDRAAAAVALGANGDEARRRLREIAATTGDVRLRIVIEKAADDTDARAVEEALAALEAEAEPVRRARERDDEPG